LDTDVTFKIHKNTLPVGENNRSKISKYLVFVVFWIK